MAPETVTAGADRLRDAAEAECERLRGVAAILNAGELAARNETSVPPVQTAELALLLRVAREEVRASIEALEQHI